jgi:hypothetical protein
MLRDPKQRIQFKNRSIEGVGGLTDSFSIFQRIANLTTQGGRRMRIANLTKEGEYSGLGEIRGSFQPANPEYSPFLCLIRNPQFAVSSPFSIFLHH